MIGKAEIAVGGFIVVAGIIMLGTFFFACFRIFDLGLFLSEENLVVFVWVLFFLGVIDLVSGIFLLFR